MDSNALLLPDAPETLPKPDDSERERALAVLAMSMANIVPKDVEPVEWLITTGHAQNALADLDRMTTDSAKRFEAWGDSLVDSVAWHQHRANEYYDRAKAAEQSLERSPHTNFIIAAELADVTEQSQCPDNWLDLDALADRSKPSIQAEPCCGHETAQHMEHDGVIICHVTTYCKCRNGKMPTVQAKSRVEITDEMVVRAADAYGRHFIGVENEPNITMSPPSKREERCVRAALEAALNA